MSKVGPFIYKYDWKRINYLLRKDNQKKFEKNSPKFILNMLSLKK